ncbi:predicted protein [Histoplasma mississippiense (nom. inval.)]|uniref:predicted protein n=1 Tax=Ajellomyces capsulatus (strain NAm1 / WU24) TaxID=2059318 RepID=UPI000157BC09|nr:predicted protein [Histoplasma mississippiense (nom. inval.)]EDN05634.1 predicted protein [Histoplasma mississippiense (nom. inval.)]
MDGTSIGSAQKKKHNMLGRLKTALRGRSRDKDAHLAAPEPSTSNDPTNLDTKSGSVDPTTDNSENDDHDAKDHWQMVYNALSESDRNTLATLLPAMATEHPDAGRLRTKDIVDQVVKTTKMQYQEYQKREVGIRATAHKILNSALSYQDVVNNIVKFDPTGNHADLWDALFNSSEYLADLLTRCAFIEEQFYDGSGSVIINAEKEGSIVRVYVAILRYSAEVRRVQLLNKRKDIMESIMAVISKQLAQLKTSIKEEESCLHLWLLLDQQLHRKVEADASRSHINKLTMDIQTVHDEVAKLNLPFTAGAIFDSFTDQHEAECLPGTRTELLQQVKDWGRSSDRCIFWLSGMAGTGKSTIARTVARSLKEDGTLGASFFFKRGRGDRRSAAKFSPTIVKQLAVHIPQMITGIRRAIKDDPAIANKTLPEQFDKLILQPLLAVDQGQAVSSTLVVIDALDECEPKEDANMILTLLAKVVTATSMPIQLFLTSQPEQPIHFKFEQIGERHYQHTPLHKVDDGLTKHDITLYLTEKFTEIQQNPEHNLPRAWPGEEQIETLATRAAPLFIFAATEFLTTSSGYKLDDTYRPVLKQLLVKDKSDRDKLIAEFQKIIGVIILLASPLSLSSLAELLELQECKISIRLRSFHSVLTIPSDPNLPIQTVHSSFHDYLLDDATKKDMKISHFWVDKGEKHELITRQCLSVMGYYLKKNICELESYGKSRTEIDPTTMARFLPPVLQYACRYWVYHLTQSSAPARKLNQVLLFLKEHYLHWLESMSILGLISETMNAMDALLQLTKDISNNAVYFFLSDAHRFIFKFANIVDTAPLQLYSSGLVFAPQKALIRRNFETELPDWLSRGPRVEEIWSPELQILEGHSDWIQSVAFSQDGQLLASGSDDKTIKLWDLSRSKLQQTLEGHSRSIQSVAFSQDGRLLVSDSYDETIKL